MLSSMNIIRIRTNLVLKWGTNGVEITHDEPGEI